MIDGLKPYPAMKDSGVPWLGNVPEHWELRRMKTLLHERVEKGYPDQPLLAATQSKGVVRKEQYENRTVLALKDLHLLKLVRVGDFVISLRSFQGGIEYAREQGIISPAYTILYPVHKDLHGYLARLFKSRPYVENLSLYVTGIRQGQNIDYEKLSRSVLPLPPLPEQAAIVRFLDHADRRIRRYIRAKQKLIKLLEEQKQAIIHRAVTRGLDPNVRLKPSGVEWLGDVPEHWAVRQLRHMGRLHKGVGGSKEDATSDGVPCVRYGELYFHYHNVIRQPRGFVSAERAAAYTPIRFGDVLFAASGERVEEIGKSAVNLYAGHAVCGGDVVIFRPTVEVHAPFLGYSLDSYSAALQKATMCRGTTIKHIYPDELRGLWFCVPPLSEQERIATTLDSELCDCDTAAARLEREIELLREYRTRLIADVVTGKLDVREAAARLPDEAEEPEPLDEIETEGDTDEAGADDTDAVPEEAEA